MRLIVMSLAGWTLAMILVRQVARRRATHDGIEGEIAEAIAGGV
jgi:hypothetical protein